MMTQNADKKREQVQFLCMDDMVPQDHLLRIIDKAIDWSFIYGMEMHESCYGFKKEKSIYDNALLHVGKDCVLNMDLKDFFPSITQKDVFNIFYKKGYPKKSFVLLC